LEKFKMIRQTTAIPKTFLLIFSTLLLISLLTSCSFNAQPLSTYAVTPSPVVTQEENTIYKADITFQVEIPAEISEGEIDLEILDEITGLNLNPTRYTMLKIDAIHYAINLPFEIGSVIKYRYTVQGNPALSELTAFGKPIRYRIYYVQSPGMVKDIVCSWTGLPYQGPLGRIQGFVTDISNNPVPNILINVGGLGTFSASDGSFLIEGLIPGVHNLGAYSLDGSYYPFQQEARVAADSMTPVAIQLPPTQLVNVTFFVSLPDDYLKGIPVRIIGNSYSLGNTFADLRGGNSTIASRAPLLTVLEDGRYSITLRLAAGFDLEYKYSLGDGFWNAELSEDGSFRTRHLIIPSTDTVIEDTMATVAVQNSAPITFRVTVPPNTPGTDLISIQFNSGEWAESIPMWPVGNNQWLFVLYSPLILAESGHYRYCRNDQCGIADDLSTSGPDAEGKPFTISSTSQSFEDIVEAWAWLPASNTQPTIVGSNVLQRDSSFIGGVEFSQSYNPDWQAYIGNSFQNIHDIGSDWVFLTPTWHYTHTTPPVLEPVPGKDMLWSDVLQAASWASVKGLNVALFPSIQTDREDPWALSVDHNDGWWQSWFDRYDTFLIHHADLAKQINSPALIIGGETILPALTGGILSDGTSSGVPVDASLRWKQMIADIRAHYQGTLIWAIPYDQLSFIPDFVTDVDQVYVLISAPLASIPSPTINDLSAEFGRLLDEVIYPVQQITGKPFILGVEYPSIEGAYSGCYISGDSCLPFENLSGSSIDYTLNPVNLQTQLDIYSAIFLATNSRPWVNGVVSRGYYPPVGLMDGSASIHDKPAASVLWYWLPRMKSIN
jgi:hypothetical protein